MTKTTQFRASTFGALVAVALAAAGCGSSNSSSATTSPPGSLTIATKSGPDGVYLTGAGGRALYLWVADTGGKSACSGSCAKVWPPVLATGTPSVAGGATAADLATIARSDGSKQVTYKGHPLYYYVADPKAGMTTGQGSNSFGAKWWLVATSGAAITKGSSSSSSASGSSGSSSGSASGGSSTSSSSSGWA